MKKKVTYYDLLEIKQDATPKEVKEAYRRLIKVYHPDKNPDSSETARRAQLIIEAYSVLSDPVKRSEYDNLLELRFGTKRAAEDYQTTVHQEEAPVSVPEYACEMCGRQDPTLRVTIFLWVVSLLYVTWKRGWGHILCSRCRIKYSLLFNIEVWFLGWWGFPFGPIYSIEALIKNSGGGIQPEENNAILLSVLAYDFYQKGRYAEAYDALTSSLKLKQTKERIEFLNHLKLYISPQESSPPRRKILAFEPALFNVPVLLGLLIVSVYLLFSGKGESYHSEYPITFLPESRSTSIFKEESNNLNNTEPENIKAASQFGIPLNEIEWSRKNCDEAVAKVAAYIKSKVPLSRTSHEGLTTIYHYELDRRKLDENEIHPHTKTIFVELLRTSGFANQLDTSQYKGLFQEQNSKNKLKDFLNLQQKIIAEAYFNCTILEVSIPFVRHYSEYGDVPEPLNQQIEGLIERREVSDWLRTSEYAQSVKNLRLIIKNITSKNAKISEILEQIENLKLSATASIAELKIMQERLSYYENAELFDAYNSLAVEYNDKLEEAELITTKHDNLANQYNQFNQGDELNKLDGAFNECLNPNILFQSFEKVNFHSKKEVTEPPLFKKSTE
jgi:curved DNA-binding protein CbpA